MPFSFCLIGLDFNLAHACGLSAGAYLTSQHRLVWVSLCACDSFFFPSSSDSFLPELT